LKLLTMVDVVTSCLYED